MKGEKTMKILFYQDLPALDTTMLTWTLGQELILRGHTVHFGKPGWKYMEPPGYDWVRGGGESSWEAVKYARAIGARVHIHLEGVGYWRIGADTAENWGFNPKQTAREVPRWRDKYRDWMSAAYEADSCSVNGDNQIKVIQDVLFDGRPLPNCHRMSCGADARYALSLPDVEKQDYIVTCSRVAPNKKTMHIAKALSLIPAAERLPWVIIGFGDPVYVNQVLKFCDEHSIVVSLRPCFGAEKWMLIKRAKLMVQGWNGIPPAEGLLCNTPVVSFNHPDIMEMYATEDPVPVHALYFTKDNDPDSMAFTIQSLTKDKSGKIASFAQRGLKMLFSGDIYACTQEQLAEQYERMFTEEPK